MSQENRPTEKIVRNGRVMNREATAANIFKVGDRVWVQNEDYAGQELRVISVDKSSPDLFVRLQGGAVDMAVEMSWMQRQYMEGKLSRIDPETNEVIKNENS